MNITKNEMLEFADMIATAVVDALEKKQAGTVGTGVVVDKSDKTEKRELTAYQKTEQLLYNYNNFKKIIAERMCEIEEIKRYGVRKDMSVQEYVQKGGMPHGLVLEEESVDAAVRTVQRSVQDTVQAVALIDRCMESLRYDPYYKVLEMRYFEGRTQEDIALELKCNQATIARNKNRLVKELSVRLFPNQVVNEIMK